MPPRSTSTRTPLGGTNKTFTTCAFSLVGRYPRRPRQLHLQLRQRQLLLRQLLLHLRHGQHRRLGPCRRRELVLLHYRGPVPDSRVIGDQPVTPNSRDRRTKADDSPGLLSGISFPIFARSAFGGVLASLSGLSLQKEKLNRRKRR